MVKLAILSRILSSFMAVSVYLLTSSHVYAQLSRYSEGPLYNMSVRGLPVYCNNYQNQPVAFFSDRTLNNIGVASTYGSSPYIVMNPNITNQFSDLVTVWWVAHECAHHALPPRMNNEQNADCYAIRALRAYGLVNNISQLQMFAVELKNLQGSAVTGHLPDPARANHIAQCALT